ncbi:short chain dehydrogenase, partial [Micromonospora sp. DH15]|nr:short chain dehydrogenase [Micromonospora sp. DH15]
MTDRYASFVRSGAGRALVKRLGLPDPPRLRRHTPGDPLLTGPALLGSATGGRLAGQVGTILTAAGVELRDPATADAQERFGALVYDATGVADSTGLRQLYDFFHPRARSVLPGGRVIVLGTPPDECGTPREATAQRALEGL